MSELKISGLDELTGSLAEAINKYPDMAEVSLKKMGNKLKREVVKKTKSTVKQHTGKLVKGYKVSKVKGYGANMEVEFSGTAPHFHLVENGHNIVTETGKTIGFVPGGHIVKTVAADFDKTMSKEVDAMVDKILSGSDLK